MSSTLGASLLRTVLSDGTLKILGSGLDKGPIIFCQRECGPQADFFPVVVWGNNAEPCGKYLQKGSLCAVKGAMQNRSYDDKDGNKRYITELIADEVEFLQSHKNSTSEADSAEVPEEEIPF